MVAKSDGKGHLDTAATTAGKNNVVKEFERCHRARLVDIAGEHMQAGR